MHHSQERAHRLTGQKLVAIIYFEQKLRTLQIIIYIMHHPQESIGLPMPYMSKSILHSVDVVKICTNK